MRPSTRPAYRQITPNTGLYDSGANADTAPVMPPNAYMGETYPDGGYRNTGYGEGGYGNAGIVSSDNSMMWTSVDNAASDPIY